MNIKPYSKNAKVHPDKQLKQIARSIKEFNWQQPIVVDKDGVIIVGHGRWFAYEKYKEEMSLPKPEIKIARTLTKEQVKAYRLADNKLNESVWDLDLAIPDKSSLSFAKEKSALGGKKYDKVIGDNVDYDPEHIFRDLGYCKEIFLWGADYYAERLQSKNEGSWIVWDKRLEESADKMYGSCFELCWSKNKHKREIARVKWAGIFGTEKEPEHKRFHPTQKPVDLSVWFIKNFSGEEHLVADLFLGSGSTLIACEKTNRIAFGMEINEKYCDVIIKRYEEYTGNKAKKIN